MTRNPVALILSNLVTAAEGARYTLPTALLDAWSVHEQVRALTVPEPDDLTTDTAAQRLVAAVAAGEPADVLELARTVQVATADRASTQAAYTLHAAATKHAADTAIAVAADLTETIINEYLAPALDDLYAEARTAAHALEGLNLADTHAVLAGTAKQRAAFQRLPALVARRQSLFRARGWANRVGGRQPQHDEAHLFTEFEDRMALHAEWKPTSRPPTTVGPADPTERLLWVVGPEAEVGKPWMPTVQQMDAAWWKIFGPGVEARAQGARNAVAYGAALSR